MMRRLHAAKDDLDWLPKNYRLLRGAIVGGVWTVIGSGVAAATFFVAHDVVFLCAAGGGVGYELSDRLSKRIVKSRLGKLASGRADLARLSNSEDGDLVHVRGVVRATSKVESMLGGAAGVYRRVRASIGGRVVIEERAMDFELVDGDGNAILIETERAHWLVNHGRMNEVPLADLQAFYEDERVAKMIFEPGKRFGFLVRATPYRAAEVMLYDGEEVEVVGYKARKVDQRVADRMARETPMRATIRGGKELPVMISRVRGAW